MSKVRMTIVVRLKIRKMLEALIVQSLLAGASEHEGYSTLLFAGAREREGYSTLIEKSVQEYFDKYSNRKAKEYVKNHCTESFSER